MLHLSSTVVIAVIAFAAGVAQLNAAFVLEVAGVTGLILLIFITCFKIGMLFFGGGFVLVAVLQNRLVTQPGWLSPRGFLDGLAISNLAPGPIALIATFAGTARVDSLARLSPRWRCSVQAFC